MANTVLSSLHALFDLKRNHMRIVTTVKWRVQRGKELVQEDSVGKQIVKTDPDLSVPEPLLTWVKLSSVDHNITLKTSFLKLLIILVFSPTSCVLFSPTFQFYAYNKYAMIKR